MRSRKEFGVFGAGYTCPGLHTAAAEESPEHLVSAIRIEMLIQVPENDALSLESALGAIAAALHVPDDAGWPEETKSWLNDGILWLDFTVDIKGHNVVEAIDSCREILECAAVELYRAGYWVADKMLSVIALRQKYDAKK